MEQAETKPSPERGWVLYDDACGFCRRWVPYWESTLVRRGFRIAPLQSPWVADSLDVPEDTLIDDLRLLRPDGSHVEGADVYRIVMRRIWWALPLYLLSVTPGLRRVFDAAYRAFAANRYRFSSACDLPGAAPRGQTDPGP